MEPSLSQDGQQVVDEFANQIRSATESISIPFGDVDTAVETSFRQAHQAFVGGSWQELAVNGSGTDEDLAVISQSIEAAMRTRATPAYSFAEAFALRRLATALGLNDLAESEAVIVGDLSAGIRITGAAPRFGFGQWADHRLYLTQEGDGFALRDAPASSLRPVALEQADHTRPVFELDAAEVANSPVIATLDAATAERFAAELVLLQSTEILGSMSGLFDSIIEHVNTREQFGKPLSAFQALAHRVVDTYSDLQTLRSLVNYGSWLGDDQPEQLLEFALMAKGYGARAAFDASAEAVQMHGAMGFTWERGLQFPIGRIMALALSEPSGATCLGMVGRRVIERGELIAMVE